MKDYPVHFQQTVLEFLASQCNNCGGTGREQSGQRGFIVYGEPSSWDCPICKPLRTLMEPGAKKSEISDPHAESIID